MRKQTITPPAPVKTPGQIGKEELFKGGAYALGSAIVITVWNAVVEPLVKKLTGDK